MLQGQRGIGCYSVCNDVAWCSAVRYATDKVASTLSSLHLVSHSSNDTHSSPHLCSGLRFVGGCGCPAAWQG